MDRLSISVKCSVDDNMDSASAIPYMMFSNVCEC